MEGKKYLFKKKLKATDVKKRLAWKTKQLGIVRRVKAIDLNQEPVVLPTDEEEETERFLDFKVCDYHDQIWDFGLTIGKFDPNAKKPYYPKPVIDRGWKRFVREYALQVGDEIIFYKNVDPRPPTDEMQQVPFTIIVNKLPPRP